MHGKCLAVPFLIMTNYGQVENAVEAMQLGAVNYLCKPVQPDRLLEAIGKVFSRPKRDGNVFYRGESYKAQEMYRQIGAGRSLGHLRAAARGIRDRQGTYRP